jgi:hypothetical protein
LCLVDSNDIGDASACGAIILWRRSRRTSSARQAPQRSDHSHIVAMPAEDGGGAAVGTPRLTDFADTLLARACVEPKDAANGFLHRKVSGRPDVGASFGEKQIDFGRPASDALDLGQQRDRLFIVGGEGGEVEFAIEYELRQTLGIALFLRRQAAGAKGIEFRPPLPRRDNPPRNQLPACSRSRLPLRR